MDFPTELDEQYKQALVAIKSAETSADAEILLAEADVYEEAVTSRTAKIDAEMSKHREIIDARHAAVAEWKLSHIPKALRDDKAFCSQCAMPLSSYHAYRKSVDTKTGDVSEVEQWSWGCGMPGHDWFDVL